MQVRSFVAQRDVTARAPTAFRPPLAYEFAVVRRLAAEQGVLLNNQSSAGFETSPGVSRHFERATDRALGFFYDFEK